MAVHDLTQPTPESALAQIISTVEVIRTDLDNDVRGLDPRFYGAMVAGMFGRQAAAIDALAGMVSLLANLQLAERVSARLADAAAPAKDA